MVFYAGERFEKQFCITGLDVSGWQSPAARWVFAFFNGDEAIIQDIHMEVDSEKNTIITFEIPDGFFAPERAGPLTYQVIIYDSDDLPVLYSDKYSEELAVPLLKR